MQLRAESQNGYALIEREKKIALCYFNCDYEENIFNDDKLYINVKFEYWNINFDDKFYY